MYNLACPLSECSDNPDQSLCCLFVESLEPSPTYCALSEDSDQTVQMC